MTGHDQFGRAIDQEKFFRVGLVNLQRDYKKFSLLLVKKLNKLYYVLEGEFEARFSPKFNDEATGFGIRQNLGR
ncbi:hypothetical protein [Ascidiaceihabitans sp.]|uniref:hypothetical protein n=1 Tax=Ascidiaceihabitans sp. TaxID=1872644 RepID=UPI003298AE72